MVFPTLLIAISDIADSSGHASSLGVYRLYRDEFCAERYCHSAHAGNDE
jgi:hypothetical protein